MSECGAQWEFNNFTARCDISAGHAGAHMGTSEGLGWDMNAEGMFTHTDALGTIIWPKVVV